MSVWIKNNLPVCEEHNGCKSACTDIICIKVLLILVYLVAGLIIEVAVICKYNDWDVSYMATITRWLH